MKTNPQSGFTLTELIVAMGVASILVLGLVSLMGQGTESYRSVVDKVSEQNEARAALHYIAHDASTIIPGREVSVGDGDGKEGWDFRKGRYEDWSYGSEGIQVPGGDWVSDRLGFYLTLRPQEQPGFGGKVPLGDVCHVLYFTAVTPDDPDEPNGRRSRKLLRLLTQSDAVLKALEDEEELGRGAEDEFEAEVLAYNVVELEATLLVTLETTGADGEPERRLLRWDEDGRSVVSTEVRSATPGKLAEPDLPDLPPGEPQVWPTAVELELTLASDSSASALSQSGWEESPRAEQLLDEKNLTTFRMRVPLVEF